MMRDFKTLRSTKTNLILINLKPNFKNNDKEKMIMIKGLDKLIFFVKILENQSNKVAIDLK